MKLSFKLKDLRGLRGIQVRYEIINFAAVVCQEYSAESSTPPDAKAALRVRNTVDNVQRLQLQINAQGASSVRT